MKIACIDVGSNSIKLVVVDAAASDSFAVLAREKDVVRLGHDTLRLGQLSSVAIERAVDCIKRLRLIAEARGAEQTVTVATASVREARNASQFIKEAQRKAGVSVEILSAIEEARLIGLAAVQGCATRGTPLLNVDIGGGSTEISLMRDSTPAALFSVKLGAVGLTERFINSDPPRTKQLRALREEIRSALERPARELKGARWQHTTGTSGTIVAIGTALRLRGLSQDEPQAARPAGDEIAFEKLIRFNARTSEMNSAMRRSLPGISSQRAEIIIAGGMILEGVMQALKIDSLRTCGWALREGVLIDRLREIEAEANPPLPGGLADYRLRGVHAVGRRFGYEAGHAHQVAKFCERIFDYLVRTGATDLTRHHRTLLSAAALLHDVGYHIAHESHHKHSLYLIKNSELTGFSESERDVIANVARYHRGSDPRERHESYAALNETDRSTVVQMAAILRIADALDRRHDSRVRELRCMRSGRMVHIDLQSNANCEREISAAEQKRELFEQAFDCRLTVGRKAAAKRA